MTKLSRLHRALRGLRRRRRLLRRAAGYSLILAAAVWLLGLLFLADWLLDMDGLQRIVALLALGAGLARGFGVWARRWWQGPESEIDLALCVQGWQHIDTDLVAALQFESPEAARWGSVQLEQAVIDHVAKLSSGVKITTDPTGQTRRMWSWAGLSALVLAVTLALAALAASWFPGYADAFWRRLLMMPAHYPTATQIVALSINGRDVPLDGAAPAEARTPYGYPVVIEVTCDGDLPAEGRAEVVGLDTREVGIPLLKPVPGRRRVYRATLAELQESLRYQLYVGDARTEPGRITLVPLPVVDLRWEIGWPEYTESQMESRQGVHDVAVLAGSRVVLHVMANKPLAYVKLVPDSGDALSLAPEAAGAKGHGWRLDPKNTPLEAVEARVKFKLEIEDADGLRPLQPLEGSVSILPDRDPTATVRAAHRALLPTAQPKVHYRVTDDYGLARVTLKAELLRADGRTESPEPVVLYEHSAAAGRKRELPEQIVRPDFSAWKLARGDRVQLSVAAEDYRGPQRPGHVAESEPLSFEIVGDIRLRMLEERFERVEGMIGRQEEAGDSP